MPFRSVRGGTGAFDFRLYILARAETGIEQAAGGKFGERGTVIVHVIGLTAHRLFPFNPQPCEVFVYALLKFRAATAQIDILNAQNEFPAAILRLPVSEQR